jgi:hypothetical protein
MLAKDGLAFLAEAIVMVFAIGDVSSFGSPPWVWLTTVRERRHRGYEAENDSLSR